jgi:hypothetical protein
MTAVQTTIFCLLISRVNFWSGKHANATYIHGRVRLSYLVSILAMFLGAAALHNPRISCASCAEKINIWVEIYT